jgi:hypothetical protein
VDSFIQLLTNPYVVIFLVGGGCGIFVGREWSEISRGRFEAERAWDNRSAYRKKK